MCSQKSTVRWSPISGLPDVHALSTLLVLRHSTTRVILLSKGESSLVQNTPSVPDPGLGYEWNIKK